MPIIRNGQTAKVYKGDYAPYSFYKGTQKLAGYKDEFNSSNAILVAGITYNDNADAVIKGETVQASDYYAKDGLTTQASNYYAKDGASTQYTDTKVMGKNLFDQYTLWDYIIADTNANCVPSLEAGKLKIVSSALDAYTQFVLTTGSVQANRRKYLIPILPNTQYTYSRTVELTSGASNEYYTFYDSSFNVISYAGIGTVGSTSNPSNTFTTPANARYISFRFGISTIGTCFISNVQLELGATKTAFESYKDTVKNGLVMELNGKNFFNDPPTTTLQDRSGNNNVGTASGFTYRTNYIADIVADFVGKIVGSVVENCNIAKNNSVNILQTPVNTITGEQTYNHIQVLNDGLIRATSTSVNGQIPQQLFSFNVVELYERQYGTIPTADQTLAGKIVWLTANLIQLAPNWYGYGSCPSGNKANFDWWRNGAYGGQPSTHSLGTVTSLYKTIDSANSNLQNAIDANGFAHFIAYTDASDGVTPSTIYTDYVKLTLKFKTASGNDNNGGIKFDGVGTKVAIPSSPTIPTTLFHDGEWSFEFNVKVASTSLTGGNIANVGTHCPRINIYTSKIAVYAMVDSVYTALCEYIMDTTVQNHIAIVQSRVGNYTKIFVNGIEKTSAVYLQIQNNFGNILLGASAWDGENIIANLYTSRLYNRALSQSEITQNYLAGLTLNIPAPTDASPVTSNLPPRKYFIQDGVDKYEFTLPEELRGIGSAVDKIVFDRISKRAYVERRMIKLILNGTENWALDSSVSTHYIYNSAITNALPSDITVNLNPSKCSHFLLLASGGTYADRSIGFTITNTGVIYMTKNTMEDLATFKAWLASQNSASTPVTVWYSIATITSTPLTLTKNNNTHLTEVPTTFLTSTPDPLHPADITSNLNAGNYKYTSTDGIYEFTLPDNLRGISTALDKVVFDRVSHRGYLERRIAKYILTGVESGWTAGPNVFGLNLNPINKWSGEIVCTHYPKGLSNVLDKVIDTTRGIASSSAMWIRDDSFALNTTNFKAWLASQNALGTPATVFYELATRTRVPLTFTKVSSSARVEVPMAFLTSTPSLDYPADMWSIGKYNTVTSKYDLQLYSGLYNRNLVRKSTPDVSVVTGTAPGGRSQATVITDATSPTGKSLEISYLTNGLGGGQYFAQANWDYLIQGQQYTFSAWVKCSKVAVMYASVENVSITHYTITTEWQRVTGTGIANNSKYVAFTFFANSLQAMNIGDKVWVAGAKIEKGSIATSWTIAPEDGVSTKFMTLNLGLDQQLKKIGTVTDEYNPKTGKLTKKISDWVTLDGSLAWTYGGSVNGLKSINYSLLNSIIGVTKSVFKFDSSVILPSSGPVIDTYRPETPDVVNIRISNNDAGFNDALVPINAEIKAYFYGYKMCNADGSSPYYKSEVPYTPATWAEWVLAGAGSTKGSTGVHLVQDGTSEGITFNSANFKPTTKYGILYNVTACTLDGNFCTANGDVVLNGTPTMPKVIGNNKVTFTTIDTIVSNRIRFVAPTGNTDGTYIDFKDLRIFELPVGSQIETDFNTLTADQLAAKYTFNGLCVKNWKNIVDNSGQTSVIPTALAAGYTPYKMLYQLATPVVSDFGTPTPLPTYHPTTVIETDCLPQAKALIEATVKVEDM